MPQGRPLDDATKDAILADIRAREKSCRGIARDHGVSDATVRKIAKDNNVVDAFSREKTEKATRARAADSKAARAVEAAESLTVAAELRRKILTAKDGRDARDWATAYGIMSDKHMAYERFDADNGADEARSMLGALAAGL
ncbi:hypothetical protein, partial [Microbispora sp. NPDC049633]|uniref:hypothetical protein n=1 Tax=Microbispora sp. NPDC049633 TaxID=3154355 RepID=UPI003421573B